MIVGSANWFKAPFFFLVVLLCSCQGQTPNQDLAERHQADGPPGMVWIPPGEFMMGAIASDHHARPDEKPAHRVRLDGFWMDETEVTNEEFAEFVKATGYITVAERKPDWDELRKQLPPGTARPPDSVLVAASMVFTPLETDDLLDWSQWWDWVADANWRRPQGPGSSIEGLKDHPVVQISWEDAMAYLEWAGKTLPTEAEWEYAARGGLHGQLYPWGSANKISQFGNTWQGRFPEENTLEDGHFGTAATKSYPPNNYGLYDMAGNVWEWTADWYNTNYFKECHDRELVTNPPGSSTYFDPRQPYMPQRVLRGGSFLCHETYCSSYRVSARMHSSPDTGQDHLGFRGVMSQDHWDLVRSSSAIEEN